VLVEPAALNAVCETVAIPVVATWDGRAPTAADAVVVDARAFEDDDDRERLARELESHDVVLRVRDEDELEWVFEEIDPEIVLLAAPDADGEEALEKILDLLPDVPAGKLALAECEVWSREQVVALERAGFDGVVVPAGEIADLVGAAPPEV
jgi:indole-3-glycerol phosphate synthase